jgi:hypothetical protein
MTLKKLIQCLVFFMAVASFGCLGIDSPTLEDNSIQNQPESQIDSLANDSTDTSTYRHWLIGTWRYEVQCGVFLTFTADSFFYYQDFCYGVIYDTLESGEIRCINWDGGGMEIKGIWRLSADTLTMDGKIFSMKTWGDKRIIHFSHDSLYWRNGYQRIN